jgi:hypothetical protein
VTVTLPGSRSTARHEAAHAASLIMSGLTPLAVQADQPTERLLGRVLTDWENHDLTERNLREHLLSILVAPLLEGERIDDTRWRPDFDGWCDHCATDARQAQFLIKLLRLNRFDWIGVVCRARRRTRDQTFRRLLVAIADEVEELECVLQPELDRIAEGVLG